MRILYRTPYIILHIFSHTAYRTAYPATYHIAYHRATYHTAHFETHNSSHEIAEQFTCPMTKLEQKFDDNCSVAHYLRNLIKDMDLITECLKKSSEAGPHRWLIHGLAVRILFQCTIDIWDYQ